LRDISQRLERAGPGVIVLQEQPLGIDAAKQFAANRFVTPFGQPPAALIATSKVETKRHVRKALHQGVIELDAKRKPLVKTPAQSFVESSSNGIEQ